MVTLVLKIETFNTFCLQRFIETIILLRQKPIMKKVLRNIHAHLHFS